ncbi:hypothetical protein E3P99_02252 [Wallemia hederae]|uniref:OTU domain-containing protein n=1 Tax=Wallemia hederae TaxID=1540922 RepID=A0A4T0FL14_9BASI|nr:hypothetical protein E3P99_02252 [Wallemia hederae]
MGARKSGKRSNNTIDDTKVYERELKLQLDRLGLYTVDTPTDGSCMFHAISDQLYGDNKHHLELRHEACNFLEANEHVYAGFIEDDETFTEHVHNMRDTSTYGGHIELSALANITQHPIKVIQPNLIYVVSADNTHPPNLYVAYHNWEHYSSVRNKKGPHKGLPEVQEYDSNGSSSKGNDSNKNNTHKQQDTINQVLQCLPPDLQAAANESKVAQLLTDYDNDWEAVVEFALEHGDVITNSEDSDRANEADKEYKSPKRELEESSGEDKQDKQDKQGNKKLNRRANKAQKKQDKSDKRRPWLLSVLRPLSWEKNDVNNAEMDFIKNIKDISQSLINSPITGPADSEDRASHTHSQNNAPGSVKGKNGDGDDAGAEASSQTHIRRKRYAPELLVIVRPPPHISNNPMNLQIQLVTPKSSRQSTASDGGLSRSSSIHSDHSLSQASNLSLHSTTSQITSGGRKLIPLYNLQYHNVLTTAITDAGTDARIAKFTKRGLEIQNLINLESEGAALGDTTSTASSKKFSIDNLFKFGKDKGLDALDRPSQDEYVWNIKRLMKAGDETVSDDDLQFVWYKKSDSSPSGDNSRRSSIGHSQTSRPNSTIHSDIDKEDDETPWKFYAISKHFDRIHLGTIHPAPHHPRVVGQLKVPFPLPNVQLPNTTIKLSPEDLKDILSCTCLWLVIKEEFGGLDKRRKGDGWRIA